MTADLIRGFASVARDHDGPLIADDYLDEDIIRCQSCGAVVWRQR
jgi:hypothetical protein